MKANITIRPASAADASDIAAIANAIIRDTLITFTTRERAPGEIAGEITSRGDAFLVAEWQGKVAGFASYGPFRSGPGYRFTKEHSVQLTPAARGIGAGRALMSALESVARKNRVHVLVAGISSANPGGIAFHKAMGFEKVGQMSAVGSKAGQWLDLVLMQKILPDIAAD